jgi:hypothetical protein
MMSSDNHHASPAAMSGRPSGRVEPASTSAPVSPAASASNGRDRVSHRGGNPAGNRMSGKALAGLQAHLAQQDWTVLHDVARFRLLSGHQLQQLHFGADAAAGRAARRCLKRLHDYRLLARLDRRVGGVRAGSDGYVYAIGPVGDRLLSRESEPGQPVSRRRRGREVSDGFLQHTLAVADIYVRLQVAARLGALSVRHVETEPSCWRRLDSGGLGDGDWLKPDLLLVVATAANEFHSFVEVDRGNEHRPALLRKLLQYELAYRLGTVAVDAAVFPRVVWLVPDIGRAEVLAELIASTPQLTPELHTVALQDDALDALTDGSLTRDDSSHPGGAATSGDPA